MSRVRSSWWLIVVSLLLAIMIALVPLPPSINGLRPYWLALVVAYWVLEAPERVGLGVAFFAGLFADLAFGSLLGEQALRMVILAFVLDRFRNRVRFFPLWQQALVIGALLLNDRVVASAVHFVAGVPAWPAIYWLSPLTGALLWGPLFLLLESIRRRRGRS